MRRDARAPTLTASGKETVTTDDTATRLRKHRQAYEAALAAMGQLQIAAALLPLHHPAHQELDEARLAVKVTLDAMRP